MTLELNDFEKLTQQALVAFDRRISADQPPSPSRAEHELARLESLAEQLYAITAILARREAEMEATARLWANVVEQCDRLASRVNELPSDWRTVRETYDRLLDIRSAARDLQRLHSR
jgi:hypothetical protein